MGERRLDARQLVSGKIWEPGIAFTVDGVGFLAAPSRFGCGWSPRHAGDSRSQSRTAAQKKRMEGLAGCNALAPMDACTLPGDLVLLV